MVLPVYVPPLKRWVDVRICDSHQCGSLAVVCAHWPQGPVDYCGPCAAWSRQVSKALGTHIHEVTLELPHEIQALRNPARAIEMGDG